MIHGIITAATAAESDFDLDIQIENVEVELPWTEVWNSGPGSIFERCVESGPCCK